MPNMDRNIVIKSKQFSNQDYYWLLSAIAALSLHNLRTTIRFGGRKNVPSRIEVEAMTVSLLFLLL